MKKVSVSQRFMAKLIDLLIVFGLAGVLPYPLGPVAGFLYSIAADGMNFGPFRGQSLGKKALGLKVVRESEPATLLASVLRNAPVGVATFFAIIPVWGWLIAGLLGLPLMVMELYLMIRVENGARLGDVMGDTLVVKA